MSRIVRLEAENIKRLKAVRIELDPDTGVVVVGGQNAQGKSSVLDAIAYALGGGRALPDEPIRHGENKGKIVLTLDDLVVVRAFERGSRPSLIVKSTDGARYPSPQAMLDKLVGALSFDPLEFSRMGPKEQVAALQHALGLDFSELDHKRSIAYENRRLANQQLKNLEGELEANPKVDAPDQEVSVDGLMVELNEYEDAMREHRESVEHNQAMQRALDAAETKVKAQQDLIVEKGALISKLQAELEDERSRLIVLEGGLKDAQDSARIAAETVVPPTSDDVKEDIQARIRSAESVNRSVLQNRRHAELVTAIEATKGDSRRYSEQIQGVDDAKAKMIAESELPVDGVTFDEECVRFNDTPLAQCSASEQIRVSAAVGLSMNPDLKVLLVREGSLLDDNGMRILAGMAESANAQVFIERVGEGSECSVIIEDGEVKDAVSSGEGV